jgi:hypothetical protein
MKPSEKIKAHGEKIELEYLRQGIDETRQLKASAHMKLCAEHLYMIKYIDELYEALNEKILPCLEERIAKLEKGKCR